MTLLNIEVRPIDGHYAEVKIELAGKREYRLVAMTDTLEVPFKLTFSEV